MKAIHSMEEHNSRIKRVLITKDEWHEKLSRVSLD